MDDEAEIMADQHLLECMKRLRQARADRAANWPREQAALCARQDLDAFQSLSLQYERHYLRQDMARAAGANPHYRAVLELANRERLELALRRFARTPYGDDPGRARCDSVLAGVAHPARHPEHA